MTETVVVRLYGTDRWNHQILATIMVLWVVCLRWDRKGIPKIFLKTWTEFDLIPLESIWGFCHVIKKHDTSYVTIPASLVRHTQWELKFLRIVSSLNNSICVGYPFLRLPVFIESKEKVIMRWSIHTFYEILSKKYFCKIFAENMLVIQIKYFYVDHEKL